MFNNQQSSVHANSNYETSAPKGKTRPNKYHHKHLLHTEQNYFEAEEVCGKSHVCLALIGQYCTQGRKEKSSVRPPHAGVTCPKVTPGSTFKL